MNIAKYQNMDSYKTVITTIFIHDEWCTMVMSLATWKLLSTKQILERTITSQHWNKCEQFIKADNSKQKKGYLFHGKTISTDEKYVSSFTCSSTDYACFVK